LDYVAQAFWMLFLKYLTDLEKNREAAAGFSCKMCRQKLFNREGLKKSIWQRAFHPSSELRLKSERIMVETS
jgi:hypothetical protein